ncbi:hypothetical protein D3OALGA1CA_2186 [Olavius algarvensis associated proteobacterium Delta 3]|nr:hypothetical protein D3OALGA1CA_2186 [Olavius algarvensis associated proteobacterium Delta 3]
MFARIPERGTRVKSPGSILNLYVFFQTIVLHVAPSAKCKKKHPRYRQKLAEKGGIYRVGLNQPGHFMNAVLYDARWK